MLESKIERQVCKFAESQGWKSIKLSGPGNRGKPDRLFYADGGRVKFVEFKRPGGKLSRLQALRLSQFAALGFSAYVVESIEEGKALFNG